MAGQAAIALGAAVLGPMLFGKKTSQSQPLAVEPVPATPSTTQGPDAAAVKAQADAAASQQQKRTAGASGRADTIKTGPSGLGVVEDENKKKKTLLGF